MSYKNLVIFVTIFSLAYFLFSCQNDKNLITTPENPKKLSKDISPIDTSDGDDQGTKGLPCDQRVEITYVFHHYAPKPGYSLGIWPHSSWENDVNKFNQLRTKWGFSKYFHGRDELIFNRAISSQVGFLRENIWVGINAGDYFNRITTYGNVCAYYLDEPDYHDIPIGTFSYINDCINQFTNSNFYTGDMKPVTCLDDFVNIADAVMCTQYSDGTWLGFLYPCVYAWNDATYDQRPLWSSFKNRYGSKNKFNWIAAHKDWPHHEFGDLLGRVKNQNMNEVWLYQLENGNEVTLQEFCSFAYNNGFLKRYYQKVTSYYRCIEGDCKTCSEGGTWILQNVILGEIIEF